MVMQLSEQKLVGGQEDEVVVRGLDGAAPYEQGRSFLARPRFNSFMPVSDAINESIDNESIAPAVLSSISKYRVQYPAGLDLSSRGGVEVVPRVVLK